MGTGGSFPGGKSGRGVKLTWPRFETLGLRQQYKRELREGEKLRDLKEGGRTSNEIRNRTAGLKLNSTQEEEGER
jgi:hypothetical protein